MHGWVKSFHSTSEHLWCAGQFSDITAAVRKKNKVVKIIMLVRGAGLVCAFCLWTDRILVLSIHCPLCLHATEAVHIIIVLHVDSSLKCAEQKQRHGIWQKQQPTDKLQ